MHINHLEFSIMSNEGMNIACYYVKWDSTFHLSIPEGKTEDKATFHNLLKHSLTFKKEWEQEPTIRKLNKTQAFTRANFILDNGEVTRFSVGKHGGVLIAEHLGDELIFAFNLEHED